MRGYTWVPYFHSVALAPKKTNFVSQIIGQFNKSALLLLCQPCIQFCFYTSFLLGLTKCFSNFTENLQYEELEENLGRDEKNMFISFAIMSKKNSNKLMPLYIVQMQPMVPDP